MNREDVRDYIQRSESVFEASPQMDEANTKAAVLRDFFGSGRVGDSDEYATGVSG